MWCTEGSRTIFYQQNLADYSNCTLESTLASFQLISARPVTNNQLINQYKASSQLIGGKIEISVIGVCLSVC